MYKTIKVLAMDVDGTLTDGKINIGRDGEIFKSFDVKDGYAIKHLLPKFDILPVIITGRISKITENRAKELGIENIYQNVKNKQEILHDLCKKYKIGLRNVAYIGDDLNDLEIMQMVAVAGCPVNAVKEIRAIAHFISNKNGGDGAVGDFIEWIISECE